MGYTIFRQTHIEGCHPTHAKYENPEVCCRKKWASQGHPLCANPLMWYFMMVILLLGENLASPRAQGPKARWLIEEYRIPNGLSIFCYLTHKLLPKYGNHFLSPLPFWALRYWAMAPRWMDWNAHRRHAHRKGCSFCLQTSISAPEMWVT